MKKFNTEIIDLIPEGIKKDIEFDFKETQNMKVVEFKLRGKNIKISKTANKKHAALTFERNNIGGIIFQYGKYFIEKDGESIRLYQKGILKDREVGFIKIKKYGKDSKKKSV